MADTKPEVALAPAADALDDASKKEGGKRQRKKQQIRLKIKSQAQLGDDYNFCMSTLKEIFAKHDIKKFLRSFKRLESLKYVPKFSTKKKENSNKKTVKYPVLPGIQDLMRKNKELYKSKDEAGEEHYVDFENGKFDVITIAGFVKKYLQSDKVTISKYPIPEVLKPDGKKRQAGTFQREFDWDDFPDVRNIFVEQIKWLHEVKRPGFARPRICDLQSVCSELYKKEFPTEKKDGEEKIGGSVAPSSSVERQAAEATNVVNKKPNTAAAPVAAVDEEEEEQRLMQQLMKSAMKSKNSDRLKKMLETQ